MSESEDVPVETPEEERLLALAMEEGAGILPEAYRPHAVTRETAVPSVHDDSFVTAAGPPTVETSASVESPIAERRAPDEEQPVALSLAEEAGTLPDDDRRHLTPDGIVVPEVPINDDLHIVKLRDDGVLVNARGQVVC